MGHLRMKKKSTHIDMTAMSDVTVLLLTFFMLTSSFVKKEPVRVQTPDSVSEIKIPETDILQILVDLQGKVFMSMDKPSDLQAVLRAMGGRVWSGFWRRRGEALCLGTHFWRSDGTYEAISVHAH